MASMSQPSRPTTPAQAAAAMSAAERERAYSPSSCIGGDYRSFVEAYARESRAAQARATALGATWSRVAYGSAPSQGIELALPTPPGSSGEHASSSSSGRAHASAPLLVFFHGGYWQELSARDSCFAAAACIERGIAFAAVDYTLAPRATLDAIVDECRRAMRWLFDHAAALHIDPARVVVAGSSAGAHLAAMVALPEAAQAIGGKPCGAVLVSGIYEVEVLLGTSINDALRLDIAAARRASPLRAVLDDGAPPHNSLSGFAPSVVCWGEIETDAFHHQSLAFASALTAAGSRCDCFQVSARNHFDIVLELADSRSQLGQHTLRLLGVNQ